jgi:hypothetical protein
MAVSGARTVGGRDGGQTVTGSVRVALGRQPAEGRIG